MSKPLKVTCLQCGGINRVPSDKLGAGPKCGVCGAKLMDGKVHEVDFKTLQKAAKTDQVPLVIDFWAPWCGPCRMMAPEFSKAAAAMKDKVRYAKINTEEFPQASQVYNIRGIPTMALFKNGREVARQSGAMPASAIQSWVTSNAG